MFDVHTLSSQCNTFYFAVVFFGFLYAIFFSFLFFFLAHTRPTLEPGRECGHFLHSTVQPLVDPGPEARPLSLSCGFPLLLGLDDQILMFRGVRGGVVVMTAFGSAQAILMRL